MRTNNFRYNVKRKGVYVPNVKHIVAPRIQHHVTCDNVGDSSRKMKEESYAIRHTEDGPPRSSGVLNVVAILEHKPYDTSDPHIPQAERDLRKTYHYAESKTDLPLKLVIHRKTYSPLLHVPLQDLKILA